MREHMEIILIKWIVTLVIIVYVNSVWLWSRGGKHYT